MTNPMHDLKAELAELIGFDGLSIASMGQYNLACRLFIDRHGPALMGMVEEYTQSRINEQYTGSRIKDDGWIEWHGGKCPVPPDTMVECKWPDAPFGLTKTAGEFRWSASFYDSNKGSDITTYRVVDPKVPVSTPLEFVSDKTANTVHKPDRCSDIVHKSANGGEAPTRAVNMQALESAAILEAHNAWRRGGLGPATDPTMLGEAIDYAVAAVRRYSVDQSI